MNETDEFRNVTENTTTSGSDQVLSNDGYSDTAPEINTEGSAAASPASESAAEPEIDSRYDKYINYDDSAQTRNLTENNSGETAAPAQSFTAGINPDAAPVYTQGSVYGNPAQPQGNAYGNPVQPQGSIYSNSAQPQGNIYGQNPYGNPAPAQGWTYGSGAPIPGSEYTYHSNAPIPGSTGYNPYGYGNPYMTLQPPTKKPRVKKPLPKWAACILLAILFGVVAGGVFMVTTDLYSKLNPDAPIISESSNSAESGRNASVSADMVASTDVITNIDTSVTDVSSTVEAVMPSIVSIECTFNTQSFFGIYETSGAGSGIILRKTDSELLIATNNHVIENATSIKVCFCDGTFVSAVTKGTDSVADLAVVSINLKDIAPDTLKAIRVASMGSSDDIKVGQMAIAIGNAMGYGQSTTVGYISAKDREITVDGNVMTLLQTDAAINPGNSGGALLNIKGEVIGINSVKYADSDVEGMGFAIPISRATAILDELASREILSDEEKGYLGVYLQDVTSAISKAYNWPMGIYVASVNEGSAAEAAGICAGDIITGINGSKVMTSTDLKNSVTSHRVGTTIQVTFQRLTDGAFVEHTVDVTLGTNPEYAPAEDGTNK